MENGHENNSLNLEQDNQETRQIIEIGGHQPSGIVPAGSPRITMAAASGQMTQTRRRGNNNNNRDGDASRCLDMDGDGKVSCKELLCFTCGICTGGFVLGAILVVAVYFIVTQTQVLKTGSNGDDSNDVYDFDETRSILKDINNNMVTCGQDGIINGVFNDTIDSFVDDNLFFTIDEYGNKYGAKDYPLTFENDTLIMVYYYQGKLSLSNVKKSCSLLSSGTQSLTFRNKINNKLYSFIVKSEDCQELQYGLDVISNFTIILTKTNREYDVYCNEYENNMCYVYLIHYGLGKNSTNNTYTYDYDNGNNNDNDIFSGSYLSSTSGPIILYPSPYSEEYICNGTCSKFCENNPDKCKTFRAVPLDNNNNNNENGYKRRRLQTPCLWCTKSQAESLSGQQIQQCPAFCTCYYTSTGQIRVSSC